MKLLGQGGMGAVYLARQTDLDRPVVIKVVRGSGDPEAVERFQREARTAAQIRSDNVVQVYETGTGDGIPFIAMEYVAGCSAAELLKGRGGRLPWAEATAIVLAAAKGLAAAHALGILHRDVKPANILVAEDGRVKVADFGLAKRVSRVLSPADPALTAHGVLIGSPFYMAPEQAEGRKLDVRADIYSLGITYYELLTGRPPYLGDSPVIVLSLVLTAPMPNPSEFVPLPPAVERACLRLCAKDREKRAASMEEVIAVLERLGQKGNSGSNVRPALPGPERAPAPTWSTAKRASGERESSLPAVLAALLALAVLAGVLVFARRKHAVTAPPPPPPAAPILVVDPPPPTDSSPAPPAPTFDPAIQKAYEQCEKDLAFGEAADVEKRASETIDRAAPGAERARFYVVRGAARILEAKFVEAEDDLRRAEDDDPDHAASPRFVSYCGALLAQDAPLAGKRLLQLPDPSPWRKAANELEAVATKKTKPGSDLQLPFTVNVLNAVYVKTLERIVARVH